MMIQSLRARWAIIAVVFILSVLWTLPNFHDFKGKWITSDKMTLGLDIQGGSHIVMQVDTDAAFKAETSRSMETVKNELTSQGIDVSGAEVTEPTVGGVQFTFPDAATRDKAIVEIEKNYGSIYQASKSGEKTLSIRHPEVYLNQRRTQWVDQAIETIRNRIDEFGVSEPSITAQGANRILVQLPGIKDTAQAKELINKTARLDFMMVDQEMEPETLRKLVLEAEEAGGFKLGGEEDTAPQAATGNTATAQTTGTETKTEAAAADAAKPAEGQKTADAAKAADAKTPTDNKARQSLKYSVYVDRLNEQLKGKLPANTIVYFEKSDRAATLDSTSAIPFLLKTNETVGGDMLTNAYVSSGEMGQPVVAFRFDARGARLFSDLTKKNTGKFFAIVLDRVVKSAPRIKEPITGGHGQIELGGGPDPQKNFEEAKLISMALRAGALPAPLEQLEERTVGPSLGADAIRQGSMASVLAAVLVFIFMIGYYRSFGVVASVCLVFNILIVLAVLSGLNATLTLPGIAGLALTIGMAVDANVIIYERIKEELSGGASMMAAIREGYERAFSSIFDANLTTGFVCIILMYYGTGPIRGFAVTLLCGLAASMFTAIFFTRAIFEFFIGRLKWNMAIRWGK